MKIGILTYHHVINDGAILQTLGHVKTLQELFPDSTIEVIDYRYRSIEIIEFRTLIKNFVKLRKGAFSLLGKHYKIKKFIANNLPLSKERLVSNNLEKAVGFINRQNYDYVIVGSDEVWKVLDKKFSRKFPNIYWLPPQINAIRIGSAVSANSSNDKLIKSESIIQQIKEITSEFKAIGARDSYTRELIESLDNNVTVYDVPDPTFGIEISAPNVKDKLKRLGVDFSRRRYLVNMTSNHPEFFKVSVNIQNYAKKNNIQIVGIGQFNSICEVNLTDGLNPIEWATCYQYFDFCITDRFHSTIFSIKANIPFFVVEYKSKYKHAYKGKIVDLLTKIDKMNHHIFCDETIQYDLEIQKIIEEFNPEDFIQIVINLKEQFRNHLKNNLVPIKNKLS